MTRWLTRIVSAIREFLGVHDTNREPVTPEHGWLLRDLSKPKATVAPPE